MFDFELYYASIAALLPDGCVLAEVGVADGDSALFLAKALRDAGKKFTLYMIDSMDYGRSDQIVTVYNNVVKSGCAEFIQLFPYSSLDGSCKFPDNHFDFVFIDASHLLEETKADIRLWYYKVKEGGILAGHDYHHALVSQAIGMVIPEYVQRGRMDDGQEFERERVLHIEETRNKFGVWWIVKKFYLKLL